MEGFEAPARALRALRIAAGLARERAPRPATAHRAVAPSQGSNPASFFQVVGVEGFEAPARALRALRIAAGLARERAPRPATAHRAVAPSQGSNPASFFQVVGVEGFEPSRLAGRILRG